MNYFLFELCFMIFVVSKIFYCLSNEINFLWKKVKINSIREEFLGKKNVFMYKILKIL